MVAKAKKSALSLKQKRQVRKMIKGEEETHQRVNNFNTTVGTPGTTINDIVTYIQVGPKQEERIGNEIYVTGFYGEFEVIKADTTNHVRFLLYTPKDISGANMDTDGVGANSFYDMDKFNVWVDKHVTVDPGSYNKVIKIKHKFKYPMKVTYRDNTYGSEVKNRMIFYVVSDSALPSNPSVIGYYRLFFKA